MRKGTGALASKISLAINGLGLTNEEVGDIVDASARSVARWVAGDVVPRRLHKERLLELVYVAEAVYEVLPADHARIWILSPNRLIRHRKPADLIRDGQFKDVLGLIGAMADGVIV